VPQSNECSVGYKLGDWEDEAKMGFWMDVEMTF